MQAFFGEGGTVRTYKETFRWRISTTACEDTKRSHYLIVVIFFFHENKKQWNHGKTENWPATEGNNLMEFAKQPNCTQGLILNNHKVHRDICKINVMTGPERSSAYKRLTTRPLPRSDFLSLP